MVRCFSRLDVIMQSMSAGCTELSICKRRLVNLV